MAKKLEDTLIDSLNASFWKSTANVKDWISTGNHLIDVILSNKEVGGYPVGRLIEIAGSEGAGKSLLASYAILETQKKGGVAILLDSEHAATLDVMQGMGVDIDKLVYLSPGTVEEVFDRMEKIVSQIVDAKTDRPITIIWDSVAATSTKAEIEGDYGQATIALQARLIGQGLRKYIPICSKHNVCLIFINQLRTKIGVTFGDDKTTPGGKAIPFHASIRLRLSHYKNVNEGTGADKKMVGRIVKCEVKKNKVAPPMRTIYFHLAWGDKPGAWIDEALTLWDEGLRNGFLKKVTMQKCSFTYPSTGETVEFTKRAFKDLLKDEGFKKEINKSIDKHYIITGKLTKKETQENDDA